jgi:hypothetical protein
MFTCVCIDDYDGPEVYSSTMRKAKKEHICGECRKPIKVGETYEYVTGLWDGRWDWHKTCRICVAIRDDFMECGWIFGQLWEDLRNIYGDYPDDEDEDGNPEFDWLEA